MSQLNTHIPNLSNMKSKNLKEKEERTIDTKIIKCQYINNFGSLDNVDDF